MGAVGCQTNTGSWGGNQPRYLLYNTSGNESALPYKDSFANLGGPTLDLDSLPSPAYRRGPIPARTIRFSRRTSQRRRHQRARAEGADADA